MLLLCLNMKIIRHIILILVLGLTGFTTDNRIVFTEYNLSNGLHVILQQDHSVPVVAINVMYHVGSKNENPDRNGFAHFFEHLMFEGSKNIARGDYLRFIQFAGGKCNAFTTFDRTTYFETLPSNHLEMGLWMESERMLHLKIDSIGVETQRKIIKEERKTYYENQPYGSFLEKIFSSAFTAHPYRWVPIGEVQYIDMATISEFMQFYTYWYTPRNAVLTICGDIQIEETMLLVKKYFDEIPPGPKPPSYIKIFEPPKNDETIDTVYDNINVPAVFFAYHVPPAGGADYYAVSMIQKLLSDGKSSRLYKNIMDKQQIALEVSSYQYALEDTGLLIIYGLPNMESSISQVKNALDQEIEKIINNDITETEHLKLLNKAESDYYSGNSTLENLAIKLSTYYTLYKNTNLINTEIHNYRKVSRQQIRQAAAKYLQKKNRVVLYYLSKNKKSANYE